MNPAIWLSILLPVGLIGLFAFLASVLRRFGGHAPGWRVRCTRCNKMRDAGEVGMVRIGAVSAGKFTFGWCGACRGFHFIAIERKPDEAHE